MLVVVGSPGARVVDRSELARIQAFIAQAPVERFNHAILRLPGRMKSSWTPIDPSVHCLGGELGAVVDGHGLRDRTLFGQALEGRDNAVVVDEHVLRCSVQRRQSVECLDHVLAS